MIRFSRKVIFKLILFSLILTSATYFFTGTDSLSFDVPINAMIRGFPSHFFIIFYSDSNFTNLINVKFQPGLFLLDLLFFVIVLSALYQIYLLIKTKRSNVYFLLGIILVTMFFMRLNIVNNDECVSGFPVSYVVSCIDNPPVSTGYYIFGLVVDFIFWGMLTSLIFSVIFWFSQKPLSRVRYFLVPLFLNIAGFLFHTSCGGIICLFEGYGFPLGYYNDGKFILVMFLIDYFLLALAYLMIVLVIRLFRKILM